MDISPSTFQRLVPSILDAIAKAHFITLDLELSGIPSQQPNKRKAVEGSNGKPALQERYAETRIAAEKYQVLQLGITCVEQDGTQGLYVMRPYNFYVNPIPDAKLEIERIFSFQSGAVEFLLGHNFRMEAPFIEGIQYFSREEEDAARRLASARQDRAKIADIGVKKDDVESIEFMERVRGEIDEWKNLPTPKPSFLNIAPIGYSSSAFLDRGLNNFQKRLVHQLVRAEYPGFVTISRPGFIQIIGYEKEREEAVQKSRNILFEEKMARQLGLRWLVEGMVGGDLTPIIPWNFQPEHPKPKVPKEQFANLFGRLKEKRTILVGHNVFLDLIYFYASFFGKLPDQVEDFQRKIHELFPMVIDTKYLATHDSANPAIAKSSLEELDKELAKLVVPLAETHPDHLKYNYAQPAHEAGFDSYLTAKVLIRLATKLKANLPSTEENSLPEQEEEEGQEEDTYETAPEDSDSTPLAPDSRPNQAHNDKKLTPMSSKSLRHDLSCGGVPLPPEMLSAPINESEKTKAKKSKAKNGGTPKPTAFSHTTKFNVLATVSSEEDLINFSPPSEKPIKSNGHGKSGTKPPKKPSAVMMPPFEDSAFWDIYGNRLRVNGTIEGVCRIGSV